MSFWAIFKIVKWSHFGLVYAQKLPGSGQIKIHNVTYIMYLLKLSVHNVSYAVFDHIQYRAWKLVSHGKVQYVFDQSEHPVHLPTSGASRNDTRGVTSASHWGPLPGCRIWRVSSVNWLELITPSSCSSSRWTASMMGQDKSQSSYQVCWFGFG